eukprot:TRINITY_DN2915_c0_g2_i1.p1 TRINITY_DN2915_c0_g2~~TRINITY_DN2915_c0_g2_i1.p1  ORF type:complete len:569 (-),score=132.32 TRINITY_DN2915_c0_g2_i1:127-1833(-)
MGIEGLLQVLKPITLKTHIKAFANKTAAIDASSWLYKGVYSCSWEVSQGIETYGYLHFMVSMIQLLQRYEITPVFVFDGPTLPLKRMTADKRSQNKQANKKMAEDFLAKGEDSKAKTMYSRCMSITKEMSFTAMDLLHHMGIKYVVAPYEADVQLAYFCVKGVADFVISEDSDLLVYGCPNLVLKLDSDGNCENITLQKTLTDRVFLTHNRDAFIKDIAEFSHDRFVELCILAGCDYLKNIPGIGLRRAVKFLKSATLEEAVDEIDARGPYAGKVPEDYLETAGKIKAQFSYGWVVDVDSMQMVRFQPLNDESVDVSELGDKLDDAVVKDYATGLYDTRRETRRERRKSEELQKIRMELENYRGSRDMQAVKAEIATSVDDLCLVQECNFEESKEILIRKFTWDDLESNFASDELIKARKRKPKDAAVEDLIPRKDSPIITSDLKQKPTKSEECELISIKEVTNDKLKPAKNKSHGIMNTAVIKRSKPSSFKKSTSGISTNAKEARQLSSDTIRAARCKYFEPKATPILVTEEPAEVIFIDDDSEVYMEKMHDIMIQGVKRLDNFYDH